MTSDITTDLPTALEGVERPGDFAGAGAVALPIVRLVVDGVGLLGLPVTAVQAEALAGVATPAPYGRGADTIVDPSVRRCGQIAASAVHADDPRWRAALDAVVQDAARTLGAGAGVEAELYKLLVYREGDFFLEHRDTEKAPGMFATLVVVLPSEHAGGELVVRHQDRELTLDLSGDDLGVVRWAAFHADCRHELRPVRSGHRVALVYNLVRRGGRAPGAPDPRDAVVRVAGLLRAWAADPGEPPKVVLPLAHHYTPAELSFAALKNADAAVAEVLLRAAVGAGCAVRLAMISIEESGLAEEVWTGSRRRFGEPGYEAVEVMERTEVLEDWRRPDGRTDDLPRVAFDATELAPPGALDDEAPDEESFREASGNEGATFERTYRRAALVLWPETREAEVLWQADPADCVPVLGRLAADPASTGRALTLAEAAVRGWPRPGHEHWSDRPEHRALLVDALARLPDAGLLARFFDEVVAAGAFDGSETAALVAALPRLEAAGERLRTLAVGIGDGRYAAAVGLLRAAAASRPDPSLRGMAAALLDALPVADARRTYRDPLPPAGGEVLADLLRALDALDAFDLATAASGAVLAARERWPLDGEVVPALLALAGRGSPALHATIAPLRAACVEHLRARVALPLEPPPDAARSAEPMRCRCADCTAVRGFLESPRETVYVLKAAKERRAHVEGQVRGCDVDCRTERTGNPHGLVMTKNRRSFEARKRQRAADLEALGRLGVRGGT